MTLPKLSLPATVGVPVPQAEIDGAALVARMWLPALTVALVTTCPANVAVLVLSRVSTAVVRFLC